MRTKLHQDVLAQIREHRMIDAGDRIAVAVSGGGDSVALLLLLEDLQSELGITLLALHFNHQLRGESSEADEAFVSELAAAHQFELLVSREDVAGRARQQHANLEDVARQRRYGFFSNVVAAGRASRVAVGHTADDQAETVLGRLMRGTGPLGLAGIYPVVGSIFRPLLGVRRQMLRDYLLTRKQAWREDQTNLDTTRLRARIRERLLPQLEHDFGPAIVEHLCRLAALARADEAFWGGLLEDRFRALVNQGRGEFSLAITDLLAPLPLRAAEAASAGRDWTAEALTSRLVRRIVEAVKGDRRQLSARHVEQILRLAKRSSSGHQVELPGGVVAERRFDRLHFFRRVDARPGAKRGKTASPAAAYSYPVELPAEGSVAVKIAELGKHVRLKLIDWPGTASDTSWMADALDADLLRPPLVLRNWLPGDAYLPKGRRHTRKLKRLLLEHRVPARERSGWPVLTSAGRLAWAQGLPVAAEFAARPGTRTGVVIAEEDVR